MNFPYSEVIALMERLHRRSLDVIKLELDAHCVDDVTGVQAMILFNMGDLEMAIGELMYRGCYLGANLSHNVKKLLANGYIVQERSSRDRRTVRVRLSEKGLALRQKLNHMYERHMSLLSQGTIQAEDMVAANRTLRRLDRFWIQDVDLGRRAKTFPSAA